MEIKKTEAADLENKKSTSYLIGFVLVFALLFAAFEFTTYEKAEVIDTGLADIVENIRDGEWLHRHHLHQLYLMC